MSTELLLDRMAAALSELRFQFVRSDEGFPSRKQSADFEAGKVLREYRTMKIATMKIATPEAKAESGAVALDEAAYSKRIEIAAKAIYEDWNFAAPDEYPWVDGGNSLMQCKARSFADTALSAAAPAALEQAEGQRVTDAMEDAAIAALNGVDLVKCGGWKGVMRIAIEAAINAAVREGT